MKQIAVIGKPEFTLGFQLAGIREIRTAQGNEEQPDDHVRHFLDHQGIGIVIIDEATFANLSERTKEEAVASITPVFVTVSETSQQEELRRMILQSIGVDLMKESEDETAKK